MSATIIPFRPKTEVSRQPERVRSPEPAKPMLVELSTFIRGDVGVQALVRGLATVGLKVRYDSRLGGPIIVPNEEMQ